MDVNGYAAEPLGRLNYFARNCIDDCDLSAVRAASGCGVQGVVPAGLWFAAQCADPASCSLVGCTVAPGLELSEFEMAATPALLAAYPQHRELILRRGK